MTEEQKEYYAQLMKEMILADEVVEDNERIAYDDICKFCDIKAVDI